MGHWVWHPHSNSNKMECGEGGHAQKIPINSLRTSRKKHNVNRQPVFYMMAELCVGFWVETGHWRMDTLYLDLPIFGAKT